MHKLFIAIYRYFRAHRPVMWTLLVASSLVFGFFGLRLVYEEDLTKLLPKTEKSSRSGLAFGQLSVKDKVFVEFVPKSDSVSAEALARGCDEFIAALMEKDSSASLIANVLYRIEDEWLPNAMDYALACFPAYIDSSAYDSFDALFERDALDARMAENVEIMSNDWDGTQTTAICYDPAGLRYPVMEALKASFSGDAPYRIVDRHLFSPDGKVCVAYISQDFKSFDSMSGARLVKMISSEAESFEKENPQLRVLYHGATVNAADNSRTIKQDLVLTIGISLLIILALLLLCFRNKTNLLHILLPIVYGTLFAMASVYWIKGRISLMAMGLSVVVLGIAVSYVLHVLTQFKYVADAEQVLRAQSKPVCLGCITTIGAFAGLLFTKSELLSDFGLFASLVLLGTTFCALVFLPQFLDPEKNRRNEKAFRFLEKINSAKPDRRRWLLCLIAIVSIVCFCFAPRIGFDSNLKHIGYESPVNKESQKVYAEKFNHNLQSTFLAVSAPSLDEALALNKGLGSRLDSLQAEGIVKSWSRMSSALLSTSEMQANIDRWKAWWTPERQASAKAAVAAAARRQGLEEDIFDPFYSLISRDYEVLSPIESGVLPVELSCNMVEQVGDSWLVFTPVLTDPGDKKAMCDAVSEDPSVLVVDPFYYTSDMVSIVNNDFNTVLLISSFFVLLVLLLSFRNVIVALIAFVPMCASWFITEGAMAMSGMQFNLINILISSLVFGVGVDYSIFIMDGLLAASRGKGHNLLVYHKTAISLASFILCVVVASLLISRHPALTSVGISTLIGMISTMVYAYCVEPFLFRKAMKIGFIRKRILK
ncbi:MAG: MMPL family transporter [Candidatus Cryptobacteroides sp.]|nr:MMPL family transporter [Bacteroidales bacterium]MDY5744097.1 MMPL family transporter [Candidatus Cryptobacteroides sp.]